MKKKIGLVLLGAIMVTLVACGKETSGTSNQENKTSIDMSMTENDTQGVSTEDKKDDKQEELTDEYLLSLPETPADQFLYEELADGTISIYSYIGEYGEDKIVVVPAQIDGKDVTDIHFNLFSNTIFKAVVTGKNIVEIPSNGFSGAKIQKVFINGKTVKIKEDAFINAQIEDVSFSDSVEELCIGCFTNCTLESIRIPATIKLIDDAVFSLSDLKEVYFEGGDVMVCDLAFGSCKNLEKVYVPDCGITFEEEVFYLTDNVTIVTPAGSKAEEYAKANGIKVENE